MSPARVLVQTGIDVLRAEGFARLNGRHVGLLTNQSGRASDGTSTIDLLHAAKGVTLVALFSPEHGIRGTLDENVPASTDTATGLPIYSLYGATRRPTAEMLKGIDAIVVDLQDIGVRFYTYPTTVAYVMEEAAKRQIKVVVLDRPNPVNGWQIEGPTLETAAVGFRGYLPSMPIRHGLTIGELARLLQRRGPHRLRPRRRRDQGLGAERWFDDTGLGGSIRRRTCAISSRRRSIRASACWSTRTFRWAGAPTRPSSRLARHGSTVARWPTR